MTNFNKYLSGIFVCSMLMYACSGKTDSENTFQFEAPLIETELVLSIGDTEEYQIGDFWHIGIDSQGRIYIPDDGLKTVHVFDADGSFITNIGREGRGPSEFESPVLTIGINDELLIYDWNQSRVQIFEERSDNWVVSSTFDIQRDGMAFPVGVKDAGNNALYVEFVNGFSRAAEQDSAKPYIKMTDRSGAEIIKKIVSLEPNDMVTVRTENSVSVRQHPFGSESHSYFIGSTVYHAWGGEFKVYKTSVNGIDVTTEMLFSHKTPQVPVTATDLNEEFDRYNYTDEFRRATRESEVLFKPLIYALAVDDSNQIWIKRRAEENEPNWFIFTESGELMNTVILPNSFEIKKLKNGLIYGVSRDDLDVPKAQVLRILSR